MTRVSIPFLEAGAEIKTIYFLRNDARKNCFRDFLTFKLDQQEQRISFFALTEKWRLNFISKVLKNEPGGYRVLWPRPDSNARKENCGNPSVKISCMILSYFTYLVCKLFWLINFT